jgi:hypothetical protein
MTNKPYDHGYTSYFTIEKTDEANTLRAIMIEVEAETGERSVYDILEFNIGTEKLNRAAVRFVVGRCKDVEYIYGEVEFKTEFTGFGKTKILKSKLMKLFASLQKGEVNDV